MKVIIISIFIRLFYLIKFKNLRCLNEPHISSIQCFLTKNIIFTKTYSIFSFYSNYCCSTLISF